jgi:glycosyltransferase involved in cell wall biosynthesis
MTAPLVSVIIPTHRRPELLRRAVASVLTQTYPAIEIDVIENGGRAGAQQVAQELTRPSRPVAYHYVPEGNVCTARNDGLRRSRAPYCAFLDDDDEWLPGKLTAQVQALERDARVGWIACGAWRVPPSGQAEPAEHPFYRGAPTLAALVTEWCFIWTPSCVAGRRACFIRAGGFDRRWRHGADYDLYLRLARQFPFAVLEEPLVRYHQHGQNMSGSRDRMWRWLMRILSTVRPAPEHGLSAAMIAGAIRQYCRWFYSLGLHAEEEGHFTRAAGYLATAIRYDPAIGRRLPWGRERHAIYQTARPYAMLVRCLVRAATGRRARGAVTSEPAMPAASAATSAPSLVPASENQ